MGFWGGLFGGQNTTLNNDMNAMGGIGSFATNLGENDLSASSNFWNSILSGNQQKIGQVLAPQIGSMQKQGQEKLQNLSQFGNRSGGTNAQAGNVADSVKAGVDDLVGSLTGSAASNLGSMGSGLLNTGMSAFNSQAQMSQEQLQNWIQSFLGLGVGGAAGAAESFGLGKLFPSNT